MAAVEWVGVLASAPAPVVEQGTPDQPELLLWLDGERKIVGMKLAEAGEALAHAASSFEEAIERPMIGRPHAPTRLRTESPALADAIRTARPDLDVIVAPTPEAAELLAAMAESVGELEGRDGLTELHAGHDASEGDEGDFSYLEAGLDPADVASFFAAAAELHRADVCSIVPDYAPAFGFSIEALGIASGVVQVVGERNGHVGLVIFERAEDRAAYLDAGEALDRDEDVVLPPHRLFQLEPAVAVSSQLHDEITEHGWELASPDAIPVLWPIEAGVVQPPTLRDLRVTEALARALPRALPGAGDELEAAWAGESRWAHRCTVPTRAGDVEVGLRVDGQVVARSDEDEPDTMSKDTELAQAFASSPEARALESWGYLPILQHLARSYVGASLDSVAPSDLVELLFEHVPRKLSIEPTEAGPLIDELRAFYAYLARARGAAPLAARVLGEDVVPELEAALDDPSNFGLAKSLVMSGSLAGYDMDAPRPAPQRSQAASKAAKAKRKAARKARKKNR